MTTQEEQRALAHVVDRLGRRYPRLSSELVIATVAEIEATLSDARIRDYVPLLVEREAIDVLADATDSGLALAT